MPQPEAHLGHADKLFDEQGKLINGGMRKFLQGFMQSFPAWAAASGNHEHGGSSKSASRAFFTDD